MQKLQKVNGFMNFKCEFENNYLRLFQAQNSDFEKLYLVAKDPKIWEQHPENDRWKKSKFSLFFKNGLSNEFGLLIVFDKRDNNFIGSTRFYGYDINNSAIRVGFTFISKEYWGTTVNFHIKKMMLDYAFNFVHNIFFDIGVNNIRSRKAVEKIGARLVIDSPTGNVVYRIVKENFNDV